MMVLILRIEFISLSGEGRIDVDCLLLSFILMRRSRVLIQVPGGTTRDAGCMQAGWSMEKFFHLPSGSLEGLHRNPHLGTVSYRVYYRLTVASFSEIIIFTGSWEVTQKSDVRVCSV